MNPMTMVGMLVTDTVNNVTGLVDRLARVRNGQRWYWVKLLTGTRAGQLLEIRECVLVQA